MRNSPIRESNATWLVKSGDRILGPFSSDEIKNKLRKKELVAIDEIIRPSARWRVLRDEPEFSAVIDEVRRGLMTAREDTEIQGQMHATQTSSFTDLSVATESIDPRSEISLSADASKIIDVEFVESIQTPAPTPSRLDRDQPGVRDPGVRHYSVNAGVAAGAGASPLASPGVGSSGGSVSGGYRATDFPVRESSRTSSVVWVIAGIAFVAALIFYIQSQSPTSNEPGFSSQSFDRILADADMAWRQGDFASALRLYRQANRAKARQPEVISRLAPLLLHLEGQTVQAKRALTETLSQISTTGESGMRSDLEIGLGLASLMTEEYADANSRFRSALALVPTSFAAQFNSGATSFQMKSYTEAAKRFSAAGDEPAALLMNARAVLANERSAKVSRREADGSVAKVIENHQDFRQEALVIGAFLDLENGNKKSAGSRVRIALDVDPELTSDHWHDPFLYLEPLGWRSLVPYCRRVHEELKSAASRSLYGLCLFKAGQREQANDTIGDALARSPEDATLQSVNAYMLVANERLDEARAALKLAYRSDAPLLARFVRARLCTRIGDQACAEESWKALLEERPATPAALIGLATFRSQAGDRAGARELAEKARAVSPRYRPALGFRETKAAAVSK